MVNYVVQWILFAYRPFSADYRRLDQRETAGWPLWPIFNISIRLSDTTGHWENADRLCYVRLG